MSVLLSLWMMVCPASAADPSADPSPDAPTEAKAGPLVRTEMPEALHPSGACADCHEDPHTPAVAARTCDDCHTEADWKPSLFTAERHAQTDFPLEGLHAEVACDACHTKGRLTGLPTGCSDCHVDRHRGKLGEACESCHGTEGFTPVDGFEHDKTGFEVDGAHTDVPCKACHKGTHGDALRLVENASCDTCHGRNHASFDRACTDCHQTSHSSFAKGGFDHRLTGWSLERRHKVQACAACHPVDQAHAPADRCAECHVDPHSHQLGLACEDCHRPDRWSLTRFDHDSAGWALRGRHSVTPCASCHSSQRWIGLTTACWDCHALDAARAPARVPAHGWVRSDCSDCHNSWTW